MLEVIQHQQQVPRLQRADHSRPQRLAGLLLYLQHLGHGLRDQGRVEYTHVGDAEALSAFHLLGETEGILPALETAHAVAALPKLLAGIEGSAQRLPDDGLVLLGFSGRGDKDMAALERFADVEPWESAR